MPEKKLKATPKRLGELYRSFLGWDDWKLVTRRNSRQTADIWLTKGQHVLQILIGGDGGDYKFPVNIRFGVHFSGVEEIFINEYSLDPPAFCHPMFLGSFEPYTQNEIVQDIFRCCVTDVNYLARHSIMPVFRDFVHKEGMEFFEKYQTLEDIDSKADSEEKFQLEFAPWTAKLAIKKFIDASNYREYYQNFQARKKEELLKDPSIASCHHWAIETYFNRLESLTPAQIDMLRDPSYVLGTIPFGDDKRSEPKVEGMSFGEFELAGFAMKTPYKTIDEIGQAFQRSFQVSEDYDEQAPPTVEEAAFRDRENVPSNIREDAIDFFFHDQATLAICDKDPIAWLDFKHASLDGEVLAFRAYESSSVYSVALYRDGKQAGEMIFNNGKLEYESGVFKGYAEKLSQTKDEQFGGWNILALMTEYIGIDYCNFPVHHPAIRAV